jgi:molybdopterin synthase sulfur carrier subunit
MPGMAIVKLRGQLEKLAGGRSEVEVDGETVIELMRALEESESALDSWILDERGEIRRHINVFVNGEQAEPDTPVGAGDRIEILPAISGG